MANTSGDVVVSFSADASALVAEARKAQVAVSGVGEAGEQAGKRATRGMDEAERAVKRAAREAEQAARRQADAQVREAERARAAEARAAVLAEREAKQKADIAIREAARAKAATESAARAQAVAINRASGQAKAGIVQLGNQLADVGVQLQAGTSPTTILIQQGPQVANALAVMGISLTSILSIVGPVAIAVGALVLAWQHYNDELTAAEAKQAAAAEGVTRLQEALAKAQRVVTSAADAEAVALGNVTEAQLKQRDATKTIIDSYATDIDARKERIGQITREIEANRELARAANERGAIKAAQELDVARASLTTTLENERQVLANVTAARDRDITATVNSLGVVELAGQAAKDKAQADREAAEAARRRAEAEAALFRTLQESAAFENDRRNTVTDAVEKLIAAAEKSGTSRLGAEEKVRAALEEQIRLYGEIAGAALVASTSEEERASIVEARTNAIVEAERTAQAEIDAIRQAAADKEAARRRKQAEEQQRFALQIANVVGDTFAGIAKAAGDAYEEQVDIALKLESNLAQSQEFLTEEQIRAKEEQIEMARKMARKNFEVEKAASLAGAIVNTAEAVTQALASGPPPGNLVLAGISGAAGAIQIGAIAGQQPSFHTGHDPDEYQATLQRGEAVLSRQGVAAANDGVSRGMGGQQIVVEMRYGHKVFDRFIQRDLQRTGPLANAIRNAARGKAA